MNVFYRGLPIGSRAISSTGAYWTKTKRGWKANGGDTFPTPGGCVVKVEVYVDVVIPKVPELVRLEVKL